MDVTNLQYGRTIKYKVKTKWPDAQIEEVRVSRETARYVYIGTFGNERREAKRCEDHEFYDIWEDALVALTNKVATRLIAAKEQVRAAEELVKRVAALRKPQRQVIKPR